MPGATALPANFSKIARRLHSPADVVIANILANPLKLLAPILASRCRHVGQIALSGILPDQVREVESCYSPWIAFVPPAQAEGWVCLSGVKL